MFQEAERVHAIADALPYQGEWYDTEYLILLRLCGNRMVELADGRIEVLPHPTEPHHRVFGNLIASPECGFRKQKGLIIAPFAVRLGPRRFRMPDVSILLTDRSKRQHEWYRDGADLVLEVVSDSDPKRDWVTKKAEYAAAGIPEYWIADPRDKTLTIFTLDPGATEYREAGRYAEGETAKSVLLDGLTADVTAVFAAE